MATPFPFVANTVLTAAQLNAITELPSATKTGSYTLVAADAGTRVVMNVASANTVTVNNSLFSAGQIVEISNIGAGVTTVTAGAGVTINSADVLTLAQYQGGSLVFSSASAAVWFPTAKTVSSGVIQVKSTTKTDTFTMSSATYADVTGLSVLITPTSASNKVYVIASVNFNGDAGVSGAAAQLVRGSTVIGVGDLAGSRAQATSGGVQGADDDYPGSSSLTFLDSPATTSATTYKVQVRGTGGSPAVYVNRGVTDTNTANYFRYVSTITVMEVTP